MARFTMKNGIVHMDIPLEVSREFPWVSKLPEGIAVEGGSARAIARRVITGEVEEIRDIDLVCVDARIDEETLDTLASEYMPDDYSYGHGIQTTSVKEYFSSRDFTLNEVLILGGEILCTPAAFRACKWGVIELSRNEKLGSRQQAKALYLMSAYDVAGINAVIGDSVCRFGVTMEYFDIALFLNKAMSRGRKVAAAFTENITQCGFFPFCDGSITAIARCLREETGFEFRNGSWNKEAGEDAFSEEEWASFNETLW